MKKLRLVLPILIIAFFALGAVLTPSALCKWVYYDVAQSTACEHTSIMGDFHYAPEEVLPDDTELHANHVALIDLILNEDSKGYGLNINKKPIVHNYLKNPGDIIYCDLKGTSQGNLKFMLDDNDPVNQLFFAILKISDTEYHSFTFSYNELMDATVNETEIVAYKTVLLKIDGWWIADRSYVGYTKVINVSGTQCGRSIDVKNWHHHIPSITT